MQQQQRRAQRIDTGSLLPAAASCQFVRLDGHRARARLRIHGRIGAAYST
jgi:hypothetical protein